MVRLLLPVLLILCGVFQATQAQSVATQAQEFARPHRPPHKPTTPPPSSWGGGQQPPNTNGYPPPYPMPYYPYDYGWSGMAGDYSSNQYPQQDLGSHITINGKTFPPRNKTQQGLHSSVQVDGQ